ncbi:HYR domain-containing protein, partial [Salegentibacter salarius]
ETDQDTLVIVSVLDNDSDIDGDALTITNATKPGNGTVVINDNGTITYSPDDSFVGTDSFEYSITDGNGAFDSAIVTITIIDTEGPVIACPDTMNLNNNPGTCGAIVEFSIPEFSDNSNSATIEQTGGLEPGQIFPIGTTTIIFTATDAAGNTTICSFDVIVKDNEAPVVEEMTDLVVNNDPSLCGAVVNYQSISATDNCEIDSMFITEGLESGSEFPVGTTTVTYTVTDIYGNPSTESFTVTVIDNEAPAISCPESVTVSTETGVSYAVVNFQDATATDNCEVSVEQTGGSTSGSQFLIGTNTVTFTATDASGNTTQCSFDIIVEDTEDPTLECPSDIVRSTDSGICGAIVEFETPEGFDNSGNVTVEQTAGLSSGEVFPVGTTTITFTTSDEAGNTANCSFEISVVDDEAPVIEDKNDITLNTHPDLCGAIVDYAIPSATDDCGLESIELTKGLTPGSEFPLGETTVTYTAIDVNGNSINSSFTVTVVDNEAPVIACPEDIQLNVEFGTETVVVNYASISATDNCSETSIELIEGYASGEEFPIGETIVTYEVTDASGNTASCSFTVSVEEEPEETPPAPTAPQVDLIQPDCVTPTGVILINIEAGLTYSIDGENYLAVEEFTELEPGTYQVTAKDEFDQISEATIVTLEEPIASEIETSTISLCIDDSTFDLFELLQGEYDTSGVWVDTEETGALAQGFVDPAMLSIGTYTFEYQLNNGICNSTTEVTVSINDDCIVLPCSLEDIQSSISKAVTPNGDNRNDYFTIDFASECGFTYDLMIFNRWGNKIYEATNYQNDWDGYSTNSATSSNQLPSGTYFYILEIRNSGFDPIQGYIYLGTK